MVRRSGWDVYTLSECWKLPTRMSRRNRLGTGCARIGLDTPPLPDVGVPITAKVCSHASI